MQNKEIQDKIKQTNLEKYGCENTTQNPEIREKMRQTYFNKTGYDYNSQNPEIKQKIKKSKIKTNLEKYGCENVFQNPEIREKMRQTNLKKYGCENPTQNLYLFEKQQKSAHKLKEYIMPSGDNRNIQGYEHFALDFLVKLYEESDIFTHKGVPTIKYKFKNKNHIYYPDIFIPSENLIIEVKSIYTYKRYLEKNLAKQQACIDKGYNFMFMIFDRKGNLIN